MAYIHISYEEKDNDEGGDAVEYTILKIKSKYEYADNTVLSIQAH